MKTPRCYLACDLGAESGRVILGTLRDRRIHLEELHRFANRSIQTASALTWDIPRIFHELKLGLKKATGRGLDFSSISCDSWGLDYLLLDREGRVIPPAFHYRDPRTAQGVKNVLGKVAPELIFAETGIQFMPINTLYQLASEPQARLTEAEAMLNVADGFNFFLCGARHSEQSLASTTQIYNPVTQKWSERLIRALDFPERLFQPVVAAGTRLGALRPEIAAETGLGRLAVVASCSHDTGAAVAGVPAEPWPAGAWAYLSSGTWSLMGVELPQPLLSPRCRALNFTNEIGYGSGVRLLKNLVGLWMVQECRREWEGQGKPYAYHELTEMAQRAPPGSALVNPADERFLSAGRMLEKIEGFCRETGQESPGDPGGTIRLILESLALLYRKTLQELEALTGTKIGRLHIVGGGSKNHFLNQLTANALQVPVLCGPAEATAAGNILVQALADGEIASLQDGRDLMRLSMPPEIFEPRPDPLLERAVERFNEFWA